MYYVNHDVNHDVNAAFAVAANALPNRRRPNFNRIIRDFECLDWRKKNKRSLFFYATECRIESNQWYQQYVTMVTNQVVKK